MYERAISDVVIVGAGSAGLSCAYHLANKQPNVSQSVSARGSLRYDTALGPTVEDYHHRG